MNADTMLAKLLKNFRRSVFGGEPSSQRDVLPVAKPEPCESGEMQISRGAQTLDSNRDPLDFQLEVEIPAETYFRVNGGETVTGGFDPIGTKPISFIEAQWEMDLSEIAGPNGTSGHTGLQSASLSELRTSIKRIRTQADRKRLLSPKSGMALAKLETGKGKLTESDLNALEYLLGRMRDDKGIAADVALLAEILIPRPRA